MLKSYLTITVNFQPSSTAIITGTESLGLVRQYIQEDTLISCNDWSQLEDPQVSTRNEAYVLPMLSIYKYTKC
jgi:hypothetical protein